MTLVAIHLGTRRVEAIHDLLAVEVLDVRGIWQIRGMNEKEVFGMALGLKGTPCYVAQIEFDVEGKTLEITLDFAPGSTFAYPRTGNLAPVYDSEPRKWRHLNFFQFRCEIHAFVPRVDGGQQGGGVARVEVPWARPHSGFTLLMESCMVLLAQSGMTAAEVSRMVGEYAQRMWTVLHHHVKRAHEQMDVSQVKTLSVDEVSKRRGHDYLTVLSEPKSAGQPSRVLFVTEGKRAGAFLERRGVPASQIENVCLDMSAAFRLGVRQTFQNAAMVFDCFHVVGMAQRALDQVRRRERAAFPEELHGKRWLILKSYEKLSPGEQAERDQLCRGKLQTGKACNQVDALREILQEDDLELAKDLLAWWCGWVGRSRIPEMKKVARSVREHWDGIVAYLQTRITNGAAEALNGIIQTVKRKSRGFRSFEYFRTMIYLVASKLTFDLPQPFPSTHTKSH